MKNKSISKMRRQMSANYCPEKAERTALRAKKLLTIAIVLALSICLLASTAFAGDEDIKEDITAGLGQVYTIITGIVIPVAAVCLGVSAYNVFTGGERGMETAKRLALYTLAGVAIVYLAPVVVLQVGSWFQGTSESARGQVFNTN